jgi:O-antigen ligase
MYPLPNWSRVTPEWRPGQGHNGYIDTYVELGLVGLGLLLIVIFIACSGALNDLQVNFDLGSLRLTLLLAIVINNITEASILKGTHMLWFIFLLVGMNVLRPKRKASLKEAPKPKSLEPAW